MQATADYECIPQAPFVGAIKGNDEAVDWALHWLPDGGEVIGESYVNLIPTAQGGTHVNGLRTGLLEALREFCEFRNLLPRGIKLTAEDVWEKCSYVLSSKLVDPQFSGQTKEKLSSRQCAVFVSGVIKDEFSLWLNQHTAEAEAIAELCISNAQRRLKASKKVARKKVTTGPALPETGGLLHRRCDGRRAVSGGRGFGRGICETGTGPGISGDHAAAGKILNTWEVDSAEILASQAVHDIAIALGVDPGPARSMICATENLYSGRRRFGRLHIATLLCALFVRHFRPVVEAGRVYVAMPPLFRIDVGKEVFYALDEDEKNGILDRIAAEKKSGKINVQRFKGLGEMNPMQLRETTMAKDTRRLVQLTLEAATSSKKKSTLEVMDMLLAKTGS